MQYLEHFRGTGAAKIKSTSVNKAVLIKYFCRFKLKVRSNVIRRTEKLLQSISMDSIRIVWGGISLPEFLKAWTYITYEIKAFLKDTSNFAKKMRLFW